MCYKMRVQRLLHGMREGAQGKARTPSRPDKVGLGGGLVP
jgi:hypothetical protein